ncbi:MAG: glycoside hydrolase family 5 protein, partial [Candidatus Baldrarchaeia archaeon]
MSIKKDSTKFRIFLFQIDDVLTSLGRVLKNPKVHMTFLIMGILIGNTIFLRVFSTRDRLWVISSSGAILRISPLHVENGQFKDIFGNTVYLRGVVRDGFVTSCTGFWQPEGGSPTSGYATWSEDAVRVHMQQLKDLNMNVMRWLLNIEWWIYDMNTSLDGSTTNRHYRECIKDAIRIAGEYGIYIILCPYQVRVGPQPKGPYPPYSNEGDEEIIPDEDSFVQFWVNLASEVKSFPNVIYEVFNEPSGMGASTWFGTVQKVIDAIRGIGDDHIILAQYGYCGGFYIEEFKSLNDPTGNIGYANHIYRHPPGATMGFNESPPGVPAYLYEDVKRCLSQGWG